jgi:hypothetical protein
MPKRELLAIMFVFIIACCVTASPDTTGTEFWLAFPGNYLETNFADHHAIKELYIVGSPGTTGTVSVPSPPYSSSFTMGPESVTIMVMPYDCDLNVENGITAQGVHVVTSAPVSVYGMDRDNVISEAFLGIPVTGLGTQYLVQSYYNSNTETPDSGTQFAIVGIEDGTTVTMTLPVTTAAMAGGVPYQFTLNEGQAYYLYNTVTGSDLTGTIISSDKRVAVFGSHQCADIPGNQVYCDYLIEQLPPLTSWGKQFVICPLASRNNGDTYRFLASQNGTTVYLDGSAIASLNAGQDYEVIIDGAGMITSNNRILVMQYSNSTTYDGQTGDPCMLMIQPVEQYLSQFVVFTPEYGFSENYLNIMAPSAAAGSVVVDGTTLLAGSFTVVGTSGYSVVRVSVSPGLHTITSSLPIAVSVYGFNVTEAYGYPGGFGVSDFVSTPTPTVTPTFTWTITRTITPTRTTTASRTFTPTFTQTTSATDSSTPSMSPTASQTFTNTPVVSDTISPTITLTGSATQTATYSLTCTLTLTPTLTFTGTPSLTYTPTATFTNTRTCTPTFTLTYTRTITPSMTCTMTASVTWTCTPTATITCTPANSPTCTPAPPQLILILKGTYPNPARDSTNIIYWLSRDADITITIWTVSGEVVVRRSGLQGKAGYNVYFWDKLNKSGAGVASGVFIYEVFATTDLGEHASAKSKLAVIK